VRKVESFYQQPRGFRFHRIERRRRRPVASTVKVTFVESCVGAASPSQDGVAFSPFLD
jgi:hypothetical protein